MSSFKKMKEEIFAEKARLKDERKKFKKDKEKFQAKV